MPNTILVGTRACTAEVSEITALVIVAYTCAVHVFSSFPYQYLLMYRAELHMTKLQYETDLSMMQGGLLMWIAPSGGRDRPDAQGRWLPDRSDPEEKFH